jgi:TM2 domain-containing membrane protein YozV
MKDKNIAAILAFFFGWMGAHKFYLGQIGSGVVYLAFSWTAIPLFIGFIEFIILALMDKDEFNRRFNGSHTLAASPVVVNMLPPGPNYYPPQQPPPNLPPNYPPGYYPPGYYPSAGPYPPGVVLPPAYPPGVYPQGSTGPYPAAASQSAPQVDVVAKLEKLNELRIAGLLTDEEFAQQKSRILDRL